jgi:endonuclease/exonuclease/phosphatase family metal-dependent hydrolase
MSTGLRLASYNIHIGVGMDGRFRPERVAQVVRELDADVLALQEVQLGEGVFDMLAHLECATGYRGLAGPTLLDPTHGRYGNALLTRHPVAQHRQLDLSVAGYEPRGALDATVDCGDGLGLRVIATHLGLRPTERREQVQRLLREVAADHHRGPTVLLGDVNEWFLWGRPLRWLHAHFGRPPAPATFPARHPVLALDRAWVTPRACLSGIRVHRSPLARLASDHLPLVATLDLDHCRAPAGGAPAARAEGQGAAMDAAVDARGRDAAMRQAMRAAAAR